MVLSTQRGSGPWQLGKKGTKVEMPTVPDLKNWQDQSWGEKGRINWERNKKALLTTEGTLLLCSN